MNEERNKAIVATFSTFLKSNGMRETYERKIILEKILGITTRFHYQDIIDSLRASGQHIGRATVFNTLSLLVRANILRRKQFDNGHYTYETTALLPAGNQLHTVCSSCGRLSDIRNVNVIKELAELKFGTFLPSYYSLTVYGICSRCQRRLKKNKTTSIDKTNKPQNNSKHD